MITILIILFVPILLTCIGVALAGSKSDKPPVAYTYAQSLRGKPIARYIPDTDILELAPFVQSEFEDTVCEMLYVEVK